MEAQLRRTSSAGSQQAPPSPNLTRSPQETATQAFPLNDIDYESSAAAVAQELSNLQAIKRMSMSLNAADPDLPSFNQGPDIPAAPPRSEVDEDDAARLFWVPARLHPELAPKDYRTFVEDRVDRIRRRVGSDSSIPQEGGFERTRSIGGLQRQKSTLSRTIDSAVGYKDGAEILERKKSQSSKSMLDQSETTLEELETLVNDPAQIVRSFDTDPLRVTQQQLEFEHGLIDPMLPPPPPSSLGLKRSTRTAYKKGSLRKGERLSAGKKGVERLSDDGGNRDSAVGGMRADDARSQSFDLVRSQTAPTQRSDDLVLNNDDLKARNLQSSSSLDTLQLPLRTLESQPGRPPTSFQSRLASNGRSTASIPPRFPVPTISETPPLPVTDLQQPQPQQHVIPARSSSHEYSRNEAAQNAFGDRPTPRAAYGRTNSFNRTLDDMAKSPSMMIGANTRTDNVTFIPTLHEQKPADRKTDKKAKERKDSDGRKTSWGWLLGGEDKEKKEREKEEKEAAKKRGKLSKSSSEKDIVRLDVLQTATEDVKSRESLVLNREDIKLDDERKKESSRRLGGSDGKREKEVGLLASIFGGKKKAEREAAKQSKTTYTDRVITPEPLHRLLRADIDYNWTRFSILEERAIYRMAHIKLANPRRALYSQVLLSNFMYSYLAKVQQMHPQIQIPEFAQPKQPGQQQQQKSQQQHQQRQQQQAQQQQQQQQQQMQQEQIAEQMGIQDPNDEFAQWSRYQKQSGGKPSYSSPHDSYNSSQFSNNSPSPSSANGPSNANSSQHHRYETNDAFIDYDNADHQQRQQPDPWSYAHYDDGGRNINEGHEEDYTRNQERQDVYWDPRTQTDRRYEQQSPHEAHNEMW